MSNYQEIDDEDDDVLVIYLRITPSIKKKSLLSKIPMAIIINCITPFLKHDIGRCTSTGWDNLGEYCGNISRCTYCKRSVLCTSNYTFQKLMHSSQGYSTSRGGYSKKNLMSICKIAGLRESIVGDDLTTVSDARKVIQKNELMFRNLLLN